MLDMDTRLQSLLLLPSISVRKLLVLTLQPGAETRVQAQVPDDKLSSSIQIPRTKTDDLFGKVTSSLWFVTACPKLHTVVAINCYNS